MIIFLGLDNGALVAAAALHLDAHPEHRSCFWPEVSSGFPLHPQKHGDLADEILATRSPTVVVTHSDVFVLRVRRRIAEGTLSADDVDLHWIGADGSDTAIPLNSRGTPAWWPKVAEVSVFAEVQAEFAAMRRALAARDREERETRAEVPT